MKVRIRFVSGSYQVRIRLIPDTFQVIIGQESDSARMLKSSSQKGVSTLTARAQLMRAVQIELRYVQEYTAMDETCLPEWMMGLIQTHIRAAQQLSRQLWEDYGLSGDSPGRPIRPGNLCGRNPSRLDPPSEGFVADLESLCGVGQ